MDEPQATWGTAYNPGNLALAYTRHKNYIRFYSIYCYKVSMAIIHKRKTPSTSRILHVSVRLDRPFRLVCDGELSYENKEKQSNVDIRQETYASNLFDILYNVNSILILKHTLRRANIYMQNYLLHSAVATLHRKHRLLFGDGNKWHHLLISVFPVPLIQLFVRNRITGNLPNGNNGLGYSLLSIKRFESF